MNKVLLFIIAIPFWVFATTAQEPSYELCLSITEHTITHTMPYGDGTLSDLWIDIVGPLKKDGHLAYVIADITPGWDSPDGQIEERTLHWSVSDLSTYVISYTISTTGELPETQTRLVRARGWYTSCQCGLEEMISITFTCTGSDPVYLPIIFIMSS